MQDDVIGPFALKVAIARAAGAVSRRSGRGKQGHCAHRPLSLGAPPSGPMAEW